MKNYLIIISIFLVSLSYGQEKTKTNETINPVILENLTQRLVGRIGVAAQEIGSGVSVTVNGDEAFVMASTYKVAIAVAVLDLVDKGQLKLTDIIDVPPEMLVAGNNAIAESYIHPGIKFSIANLLEVMITESDNTATDVSLKLAGGPQAVTKMLRSLGITEQRVDRYTSEILRDFYGLPDKATPLVVAESAAKDPSLLLKMTQPNMEFEKDPRDQSTPKQCCNCFWLSIAEKF